MGLFYLLELWAYLLLNCGCLYFESLAHFNIVLCEACFYTGPSHSPWGPYLYSLKEVSLAPSPLQLLVEGQPGDIQLK